MKKISKRPLQRQEQPPAKSQQPFFSPDNSHSGEGAFFQAQAKQGETEEQIQTIRKAASEEQKDTVNKTGAEEDKKESIPDISKSDIGEEKKQPLNS
jgi:hypothetical protein